MSKFPLRAWTPYNRAQPPPSSKICHPSSSQPLAVSLPLHVPWMCRLEHHVAAPAAAGLAQPSPRGTDRINPKTQRWLFILAWRKSVALGFLSLKSDGNWLSREVTGWGLAVSGWNGATFIPHGNSTWRGGLMAPGDEWLCLGSVPVTRIPNPQEPHAQLSQQPR